MKCKIPEISWHNRDPVLSVDIQSKKVDSVDHIYRLASGGTDAHVLIWYLNSDSSGSDINLELAADLTRHQRAVNCVKWSPNGELLASGDDESVIFIWKQKTEADPPNILENTTDQDKEIWLTMKVLRGHMEDVYDLSWSPNSQFLISGSVDNSAMIWDVYKGKATAILSDHKGFVQGVAWDPSNQYVATLSTDRYLRIFDLQTKRVLQRINKAALNVSDGHALHGKRMRLFHDDTLQTFFRRLCFTPDGKLLLTPAGVTDFEGCTQPLHTTYGFSRYLFKQPALVLPCPDQYTVAVRCCPLLFTLRPHNADTNPPVIPLPYRMVFAVATRSSVYFYDTQQRQPFAVISNIHYTRLTDVTWSSDARVVVVSSTDGFCSLITFEKGELGEIYEKMDEVLKATIAIGDTATQTVKKSRKQKENDNQEMKSRKPSTDDVNTKPIPPQLQEALKLTAKENLQQTPNKATVKDTEDCISVSEDNSDRGGGSSRGSSASPKSKSLFVAAVKPLLAADIIIDKEILSSDEKFESPEKKSRPATPISIRRHPRTPTTPAVTLPIATSTTSVTTKPAEAIMKTTPLSSVKKTATPIAIRRTPRVIIPVAPAPIEEAMDAWPTKIPDSPPNVKEEEKPQQTPALISEVTTTDRTEDIRLVYEDTVEENALESNTKSEQQETVNTKEAELKQETENVVSALDKIEGNDGTSKSSHLVTTPQNKTPRRVELKTISTPKSKKKIL